MTFLGVDFGSKRIGIAVGESEHGVTTARPNLSASGTLSKDARRICEIAKQEEAKAIVLGIPKNPDGRSTRSERICGLLADLIRSEGWQVHEVNEAFTSIESEKNLANVYNRDAVRKRIDGEAARLILEQFFHGQT